ncbi:MAG: hypothetical protein IPJ86_12265 [Bacteroidetes bacterium]|nr:hypothetical protein [Bacteroidota bacterium]
MKGKVKITLIVLLVMAIGTEVFLRYYFGFCDTVLMREDAHYEYIPQANQQRFRFRNHIFYNSLSMRSEEVDTGAVKILGFGDSIINGGVLTDQESLATTILTDTLSKIRNRRVQFLNIAAGSWGPDNCYEYMKQHGDFNARHIYLFVSSHDAYDNMDFQKIVGVSESFPDQQYPFALMELMDRYLLPRLGFTNEHEGNDVGSLGIDKKQNDSKFNPGFESFLNYTQSHQIALTIYLHAEYSELEAGEYNEQGKEIISFAEKNNIQLIKELDSNFEAGDYRDFIHLNESGQRKMASLILKNEIEANTSVN